MALVKCRECGGQVSTKAKSCPSCGVTAKRSMSMLRFIGYTLLAFAVIAGLARFVDRYESSLTPERRAARDQRRAASEAEDAVKRAGQLEKSCSSDVPAYVMAQSFVEDRLKSPSTAKFPSIAANGVQTQYLGDCTHKVVGYVDAQNGFGAMLRTRYYVKLKNNPVNDSWSLLEIRIDK